MGIPVSGILEDMKDKQGVRRALAIPEGQPAILLMGGGLGLGGIEENLQVLEAIPGRLTLLVVAGRNERLLEKVQDFADASHHQVLVWGYTDQVHFLMRGADLLITKPGALTISEAFVLGLPMLLHDPIPGPETENAIYATHHEQPSGSIPGRIWQQPFSLCCRGRAWIRWGSLPGSVPARWLRQPLRGALRI